MKNKLIFTSILILTLLLIIPGCGAGVDEEAGRYKDGEYTGVGEGWGGEIEVRVVVSGGDITDIDVTRHQETAGISDEARTNTGERIIEAQDTDIELVTGATSTSRGIRDAVANALEGAEN